MNTGMEPTKGRYKGEEIDLADARMMLSPTELADVEVTLEDGTIIHPFQEFNPTFSRDKNGVFGF